MTVLDAPCSRLSTALFVIVRYRSMPDRARLLTIGRISVPMKLVRPLTRDRLA
jgi:hypothetical protein